MLARWTRTASMIRKRISLQDADARTTNTCCPAVEAVELECLLMGLSRVWTAEVFEIEQKRRMAAMRVATALVECALSP